MWSVGVMAYALFIGVFPYNGSERTAKEMKRAIRDCNKRLTYEAIPGCPKVSQAAVGLCKGLLQRPPSKRWRADDALGCEFLKAWDALDESLPSVRPVLSAAKRTGLFERRRLEVAEKLDHLLERLHLEICGVPIDATPPKERRGDDAASEAPSTVGTSLPSNPWKQSHSTLGSACTYTCSGCSGAPHLEDHECQWAHL